ncbi:MAG: cobalamin-binding protein, partial [Ktedonobacteraceae bacterium]
MRIVSLLASATEMIAALGCLDQLVGRSHECDYPPEVLSLPV